MPAPRLDPALYGLTIDQLRKRPGECDLMLNDLERSMVQALREQLPRVLQYHAEVSQGLLDREKGWQDLNRVIERSFDALDKSLSTLDRSGTWLQRLRLERQRFIATQHQRQTLQMVFVELPNLFILAIDASEYEHALDLYDHMQDRIMPRLAGLTSKGFDVVNTLQSGLQKAYEGLIRLLLQRFISAASVAPSNSITKSTGASSYTISRLISLLHRTTYIADNSDDALSLPYLFLIVRHDRFLSRVRLLQSEHSLEARRDAEFATAYVNLFREAIFDTVTQYNTHFLTPRKSNPHSEPRPINGKDAIVRESWSSDDHSSDAARTLLSDYAHKAVEHLLAILEPRLAAMRLVDASSIPALLMKLDVCSKSLGRVGLDFSFLVPEMFTRCILEATKQSFADAAENFSSDFLVVYAKYASNQSYKDVEVPAQPFETSSEISHRPPEALSQVTPLARLCNELTTNLNSLRLLAPQCLLHPILSALDDALANILNTVLGCCVSMPHVQDAGHRWVLSVLNLCRHHLVPYIRHGLMRGVYATQQPLRPQSYALSVAMASASDHCTT